MSLHDRLKDIHPDAHHHFFHVIDRSNMGIKLSADDIVMFYEIDRVVGLTYGTNLASFIFIYHLDMNRHFAVYKDIMLVEYRKRLDDPSVMTPYLIAAYVMKQNDPNQANYEMLEREVETNLYYLTDDTRVVDGLRKVRHQWQNHGRHIMSRDR
jgi:hypothetical protein|nr:MAG TPA: hypothetical protein [Caudoviricetes sp.]